MVLPRSPTYPIFELDLTLVLSNQYTKFDVNQIEIATCRVITHTHIYTHPHPHPHTYTHTHTHTHTHTDNISSCEIGGDI